MVYKTKQKEILINYFKSSPGKHITAGDVCEHCKAQGENIGQSTVYRQLEKLVDEGIINKYIIDPGSPACVISMCGYQVNLLPLQV